MQEFQYVLAKAPNADLAAQAKEELSLLSQEAKKIEQTAPSPALVEEAKKTETKPNPPPTGSDTKSAQEPKRKLYTIQIGSFPSEDEMNIFLKHQKNNKDIYWAEDRSREDRVYRVFIGLFASPSEAKQFLLKKKLNKRYPGSFIQAAP